MTELKDQLTDIVDFIVSKPAEFHFIAMVDRDFKAIGRVLWVPPGVDLRDELRGRADAHGARMLKWREEHPGKEPV